jgi:hypothetical protein
MSCFRDDPYGTGAPASVAELHHHLNWERRELMNVEPQPLKFQSYMPPLQRHFDSREEHDLTANLVFLATGVPVSDSGMKVVGVPVGSESYVEAFLEDKLKSMDTEFRRLPLMGERQAMAQLRFCILPSSNYLARCIHPSRLRSYATKFDEAIRKAYNEIMDDNIKEGNLQFQLPFKLGGFAMRSLLLISPMAHFAAVREATKLMAIVDKNAKAALDYAEVFQLDEESEPIDYSVEANLPQELSEGLARTCFLAWTEAEATELGKFNPESFPKDVMEMFKKMAGQGHTKRLQKTLTFEVEEMMDKKRQSEMTREEVARTKMNRNRGSYALFASVLDPSIFITKEAFALACKVRLLTEMNNDNLLCVCKRPMDLKHILTCKRQRMRFVRHDVIVQLLYELMRRAGYVVQKEVMFCFDSDKRMDVIAHLNGSMIMIDVSVENGLNEGEAVHKHPLENRASYKRGYWKNDIPQGTRFIPFIIGVNSGLSKDAIAFINEMAIKAMQNDPYPIINSNAWINKYKTNVKQRLAAAMAHTVKLSVDEAYFKSKHLPWSVSYRAQFRPAELTRVMN